MAFLDDEKKANLEILKSLDEALEKGPWESSLFLKGIGKKLKDIRDKFKEEMGLEEANASHLAQLTPEVQLIEVYISLYQSEGNNIRKWHSVVATLVGHSVSRPVYKNEQDIVNALKAKDYKINDAYVVVKVKPEHILLPTTDRPHVDREGRELLTLREGAIKLENIVRFVHISGEYKLIQNALVKQL